MIQVQQWEHRLLDLAHQALDSDVSEHLVSDQVLLEKAYLQCETITRENSKTFFLASGLMPPDKRSATRALYAFCRVSDDIVDSNVSKAYDPAPGIPVTGPTAGNMAAIGADLKAWRDQVILNQHHRSDGRQREVSLAWSDARRRYCIPTGYVEQLINGLALDLQHVRYQSFEELVQYCYGVACTVGLMSMHITGYTSRDAIPYAIRLGVALQLTNILRDVGEDWHAGRLYLPLDELAMFGLSEADIAAGQVNDRWRSFMRYQIQRAHRLYQESLPGVRMLHPDGRFAIAAAGELYRAILGQIEANDYDVFSQRASLGAWGKLRRLPGIWWRANH
jgi:15-cis-phytoene synthase